MRPPSYYNSIVKSNTSHHSSADFDCSTSVRTSSSQLRSSLSSPSSSSYVSRCHLPFVPQSTLVAHCFTGVGSSTRPYSSTGSPGYSPTSRASSSPYNSSSASSSSSLAWRAPSSRSSHLSGSSSSGPTYAPLSSRSTNHLSSSGGGSRNSAYSHRSYLSSSHSASAYVPTRASYRPIISSNYYKPIRLRERPLLTQISSQIGARNERSSHSNLVGEPEEVERVKNDSSGAHKENGQPDESWSTDVTRNISRNKYLIKFREIDKHARAPSAEVNVAATIELPFEPDEGASRRGRDSTVPDREPFDETAANDKQETLDMKIRLDIGADANASELICDRGTDSPKSLKAPSEDTDIGERGQKRAAKSACTDPQTAAKQENESEPKTTIKKEKRNIKLKLKPVARRKSSQESKPEHQLTPKITSAKEARLVVRAESKNHATAIEASSRKDPAKEIEEKSIKSPEAAVPSEKRQEKAVKVKKLVKSRKTSDKISAPTSDAKTHENVEAERPRLKDETASRGKPVAGKKTAVRKPTDQWDEKKIKSESKPRNKNSSHGIATSETQSAKGNEQQVIDETVSQQAAGVPVSPLVRAPAGRIRCRVYDYDDFNFLTVLGHGGWGFVVLAELKGHEAYFAVKCIKKITIVEDDDYDSIMIERKVLALGNVHPFICKLFCTFDTPGYLFFVMEYCAGGDLMFHVQREGKFTEPRCRFYAAEIICAIRFLHNRHIIYRDLKLDNILLDTQGHIRLVDFGMCQCRSYREEMLPSNFCGTPEYISPEIIKGVPYNHSVDWWSFGVLLYEMAVGKMPFRGNDENELLWNVCYEQIHYPMFLTKELTSLLKLLLEREPSKRMGMATCKAGDIYDQPFFRSVDWKAVEELRVAPPFVPEVRSDRDVQNFDSDFTESTCELSPVNQSTLDKIDQSQFEKFTYTNPEVHIFDSPTKLANTTSIRSKGEPKLDIM